MSTRMPQMLWTHGIEQQNLQTGRIWSMCGRFTPHADLVGKCTVFIIRGRHYRLIVEINYRYRTIYIRHILTHENYNRGAWKDGC